MSNNVYIVILAGGKGERLWPLSRSKLPKQLLNFVDNQSLLEHTIRRIKPLVAQQHIAVITTEEQESLIKETIGHLVDSVFVEPASRNTGPAILYTCDAIAHKDPNALVVFIPADHFIQDNDHFTDSLQRAISHAQENKTITLLGVQPTFPATGYGYIEYVEQEPGFIKTIKRFHEKPSFPAAKKYLENKTMLWNIGIFCSQVSFFMDEFKRSSPELYKGFIDYKNKKILYNDLPNISVDHAIMEKSLSTTVLPVSFSWSDVGNLDTFLSLKHIAHTTQDNVVEIESSDNITVTKKLTALIGVENLCVVETEDALLIAQRDDIEKVKLVLKQLKEAKKTQYL